MVRAARPTQLSRIWPRALGSDAWTEGRTVSERTRNLALLLEHVFSSGTTTRGDLLESTGLSRATVARLTDELIDRGLITEAPLDPVTFAEPLRRGRPPVSLTPASQLGQVIGVSFGLQRTVVLSTDLTGRELSSHTYETPPWSSVAEAVSWLEGRISNARDHTSAPLRRVVIAVPSRVVGEREVSHPPLWMSPLEGTTFASELASVLGTEVSLGSDADLSLAKIVADDVIPQEAAPVLLCLNTVLTMAQRRTDGTRVEGHSHSFGNFSLLPFVEEVTATGPSSFPENSESSAYSLGSMLGARGLRQYCASQGVEFMSIGHLWEAYGPGSPVPPVIHHIRTAFARALFQALRVIMVIADPPLIILTGRLQPLADLMLPELSEMLAAEFSEPPKLLTVLSYGTTLSTAHGAAHAAAAQVQQRLCIQIAAEDTQH